MVNGPNPMRRESINFIPYEQSDKKVEMAVEKKKMKEAKVKVKV